MRHPCRLVLIASLLPIAAGCSGGGSKGPTGTLSSASTQVFETQTLDFTLTLSKPAGGSGLHVPVSSSNQLVLSIPSFVDVAPGAATATFQAQALTAGGPVTISAEIRGNPSTQATVLAPPTINLTAGSPGADQLSTGTITVTGTGSHPAAVDASAVTVSAPTGSGVAFDAPVLTGDDTGFSIDIPYTIAVDAAPGSVTVTVDANGSFIGGSASFPLLVRRIPRISTFTPATATLDTTEVRPFTVTLDQPARATGETVTLSTGASNKVTVPATLVVGSGLTTAQASLQGIAISGPVTIGAALAGGQKTAAVSVADATITAPVVTGATGTQGDVVTFTATGSGSSYVAVSTTSFTLTPAGGSGLTVQSATLTGNATAWSLSATVAIDSNATVGASNFSFDANGTTPGAVRPIAFTVKALPRIQSLTPANLNVDTGAQGNLTVTLTVTAAANTTVTMTSGDTNIATVNDATVLAGNSTVLVPVTGVAEGDALITASLNGTNASQTVHIHAAQVGDVIVTEFVTLTADTSGNAGEAIELTNVSATDQTINGWTIETLTSGPLSIRAATSPTDAGFTLTLPPGGVAYGVPNPVDAATIGTAATFVYGDPGVTAQMGNTGDKLRLRASATVLEDDVDFAAFVQGSQALAANDFPGAHGHSTQLDPGNLTAAANDGGGVWCTSFRSASTLGAANQFCSSGTVVNEVIYDGFGASDTGQTFVELAGNGGAPIGGLQVQCRNQNGVICGNAATYTILAGTRMPADGFWVLAGDSGNGTTLVSNADAIASYDPTNTTGSGIRLLSAAPASVVLDAVQWGSVAMNLNAEGTPGPLATAAATFAKSTCRNASSTDTNDNATDFHVSSTPTPGAANN